MVARVKNNKVIILCIEDILETWNWEIYYTPVVYKFVVS